MIGIQLTPTAVVTGRVLDENGMPSARASVSACAGAELGGIEIRQKPVSRYSVHFKLELPPAFWGATLVSRR